MLKFSIKLLIVLIIFVSIFESVELRKKDSRKEDQCGSVKLKKKIKIAKKLNQALNIVIIKKIKILKKLEQKRKQILKNKRNCHKNLGSGNHIFNKINIQFFDNRKFNESTKHSHKENVNENPNCRKINCDSNNGIDNIFKLSKNQLKNMLKKSTKISSCTIGQIYKKGKGCVLLDEHFEDSENESNVDISTIQNTFAEMIPEKSIRVNDMNRHENNFHKNPDGSKGNIKHKKAVNSSKEIKTYPKNTRVLRKIDDENYNDDNDEMSVEFGHEKFSKSPLKGSTKSKFKYPHDSRFLVGSKHKSVSPLLPLIFLKNMNEIGAPKVREKYDNYSEAIPKFLLKNVKHKKIKNKILNPKNSLIPLEAFHSHEIDYDLSMDSALKHGKDEIRGSLSSSRKFQRIKSVDGKDMIIELIEPQIYKSSKKLNKARESIKDNSIKMIKYPLKLNKAKIDKRVESEDEYPEDTNHHFGHLHSNMEIHKGKFIKNDFNRGKLGLKIPKLEESSFDKNINFDYEKYLHKNLDPNSLYFKNRNEHKFYSKFNNKNLKFLDPAENFEDKLNSKLQIQWLPSIKFFSSKNDKELSNEQNRDELTSRELSKKLTFANAKDQIDLGHMIDSSIPIFRHSSRTRMSQPEKENFNSRIGSSSWYNNSNEGQYSNISDSKYSELVMRLISLAKEGRTKELEIFLRKAPKLANTLSSFLLKPVVADEKQAESTEIVDEGEVSGLVTKDFGGNNSFGMKIIHPTQNMVKNLFSLETTNAKNFSKNETNPLNNFNFKPEKIVTDEIMKMTEEGIENIKKSSNSKVMSNEQIRKPSEQSSLTKNNEKISSNTKNVFNFPSFMNKSTPIITSTTPSTTTSTSTKSDKTTETSNLIKDFLGTAKEKVLEGSQEAQNIIPPLLDFDDSFVVSPIHSKENVNEITKIKPPQYSFKSFIGNQRENEDVGRSNNVGGSKKGESSDLDDLSSGIDSFLF